MFCRISHAGSLKVTILTALLCVKVRNSLVSVVCLLCSLKNYCSFTNIHTHTCICTQPQNTVSSNICIYELRLLSICKDLIIILLEWLKLLLTMSLPVMTVIQSPSLRKISDVWVCSDSDHVCTRFLFVWVVWRSFYETSMCK